MEIITRYSGVARRNSFNLSGDGDHEQIIVRNDKGEEKIVFTGNNFSQEEYEKRGGQEKENQYFYDLRGLARPKKD